MLTGKVLRKDFLGGKRLADTVTALDGDEKDEFLDLASRMLAWLPEERWNAKSLLKHPFFDSLNADRDRYLRDHA